MGIAEIKKAIEGSTHSNRLFASMGTGAVIGGAVVGPLGIPLGLGWGALSYPVILATVKVGGFVKDTYQTFKHHETVEEKESKAQLEASKSAKVNLSNESVSSYARAHAAGIPAASNSSSFTSNPVLGRVSSLENFGADLSLPPSPSVDDAFEVKAPQVRR